MKASAPNRQTMATTEKANEAANTFRVLVFGSLRGRSRLRLSAKARLPFGFCCVRGGVDALQRKAESFGGVSRWLLLPD